MFTLLLGLGLDSGRKGYHGRHLQKWRNMPNLESYESMPCWSSVCWTSHQCRKWEIGGLLQIFPFILFSLKHGHVSDRDMRSACFLDCILSVLVTLKLGAIDLLFCVSQV